MRLGGKLLGSQPLRPRPLVLVIDQREDDPERQPTEHVPGGGIHRLAVGPETHESHAHEQQHLDAKTDAGGRRRPAIDERVAG